MKFIFSLLFVGAPLFACSGNGYRYCYEIAVATAQITGTATNARVGYSVTMPLFKSVANGGLVQHSGTQTVQSTALAVPYDFSVTDTSDNAVPFMFANAWSPSIGNVQIEIMCASCATGTIFRIRVGNDSITTYQGDPSGVIDSSTKLLMLFGNQSSLDLDDVAGQTATNHSATVTTNLFAGAVALNGTSQYVSVANASSLNPGTSSMTLRACEYRASTSGQAAQLIRKITPSGNFVNYSMTQSDGGFSGGAGNKLEVQFRSDGSNIRKAASTGSVFDGSPHCITAVYTSASNPILYVDGAAIPISTTGSTGTPNITTATDVYIGSDDSGSGGFFGGSLDSVQIDIGTARSAAWVQALDKSHMASSTFWTVTHGIIPPYSTGRFTLAGSAAMAAATNPVGQVAYSCTWSDIGTPVSGKGAANLSDAGAAVPNWDTYWATASGNYAVCDLGADVVLTGLRAAPVSEAIGASVFSVNSARYIGTEVYGGFNPRMLSPLLLYTFPAVPLAPWQQYTNFSFSGTYRYVGLKALASTTTALGLLSKVQMIGQWQSSVASQPVQPMVSCLNNVVGAAGQLEDPVCILQFNSPTNGLIYYCTTDGSTPTSSSSRCPASINTTSAATVTLKVVGCSVVTSTACSQVTTAVWRGYTFSLPATGPITDSWTGYPMNFNEPRFQRSGSYWYHVGTSMWCSEPSVDPPTNASGACNFWSTVPGDNTPGRRGLWMYRSTDLKRWQPVGNATGQIADNPTISGGQSHWSERVSGPHFNTTLGKYLIYIGCGLTSPSALKLCILQSATADIESTYSYVAVDVELEAGQTITTDFDILYRSDGRIWAVFNNATGIHIIEMAANGLGPTGSVSGLINGANEAPTMFERDGCVFLFYGHPNSGNSNSVSSRPKYQSNCGSSLLTGWGTSTDLYAMGETLGTYYNGQVSGVISIPGYSDCRIFMADFWEGPTVANPTFSHANSWVAYTRLKFPTSSTVQAQLIPGCSTTGCTGTYSIPDLCNQ